MKNWYYSNDKISKVGPISAEEIQQKIFDAEIDENSWLWCIGMTDWKLLSELDSFEKNRDVPPNFDYKNFRPATKIQIPNGLRGWITVMGVILFVIGFLNCATGIGLIIGIPFIIASCALFSARSALDEPHDINLFLAKIKTACVSVGLITILITLFIIPIMISLMLLAIPFFAM